MIIPYTVPYKELYRFIKSKCKNINRDIPEDIKYSVLNLSNYSSDKLKEIQNYIDLKFNGGEVTSLTFEHRDVPLKFKCKMDHEFEQTWHSVQNGYFCSSCTNNKRINIMLDKIKNLCNQKNLSLISEYTNKKTKLHLKCNKCNIDIFKTWDHLRLRSSCPNCKNNQIDMT